MAQSDNAVFSLVRIASRQVRLVFRGLLGQLLVLGRGLGAYGVADAVSERMAFQILLGIAPKALRGLILKPRLGRCEGLPLVGAGVRVRNPHLISCRSGFVLEDYAELQGLSLNGLDFGTNVVVGSGAQIRPSGYYGRDVGVGLVVGNNSNIGPGSYIGASGGITIGHNVLMAPNVTVLSEEHAYDDVHREIKSQGVRHAPTVIQDDVWLGTRVVILGGTTLSRGCVVAAGSIVRHDVASFTIVAGVPARVIGERTPSP